MICEPTLRIIKNISPTIKKIEMRFFIDSMPHFLPLLQRISPNVKVGIDFGAWVQACPLRPATEKPVTYLSEQAIKGYSQDIAAAIEDFGRSLAWHEGSQPIETPRQLRNQNTETDHEAIIEKVHRDMVKSDRGYRKRDNIYYHERGGTELPPMSDWEQAEKDFQSSKDSYKSCRI